MDPTPTSPERTREGRFAPGTSGNPEGKARGTRHHVTRAVEVMLEGEHEQLTRLTLDRALDGDMTAVRLCLDRIAPRRRDSPLQFDLPPIRTAADVLEASSALLAAVAEGEVTPDEAGRVMALLSTHRTIVECADLEARIATLEARI